MPPCLNGIAGLLTVLILAIGLTATGFAHRIPTRMEQAQQAFIAMGGSPGDICGDMTGDQRSDCRACRLVNFITPEPVSLGLAAFGPLPVLTIPLAAQRPPPRRVRDPACGVRGPPSV